MVHRLWGYYCPMPTRHPALFGVPISEIARICGVSLKTAARWKAGTICPPKTAILIVRLLYSGDLGALGPEWENWHYRDGELTSPDGWRITRNDALAVPLMHGQISALRQKLADLEDLRDGLEEQPTPGEIPIIVAG